jgi:hypothetical protein
VPFSTGSICCFRLSRCHSAKLWRVEPSESCFRGSPGCAALFGTLQCVLALQPDHAAGFAMTDASRRLTAHEGGPGIGHTAKGMADTFRIDSMSGRNRKGSVFRMPGNTAQNPPISPSLP